MCQNREGSIKSFYNHDWIIRKGKSLKLIVYCCLYNCVPIRGHWLYSLSQSGVITGARKQHKGQNKSTLMKHKTTQDRKRLTQRETGGEGKIFCTFLSHDEPKWGFLTLGILSAAFFKNHSDALLFRSIIPSDCGGSPDGNIELDIEWLARQHAAWPEQQKKAWEVQYFLITSNKLVPFSSPRVWLWSLNGH